MNTTYGFLGRWSNSVFSTLSGLFLLFASILRRPQSELVPEAQKTLLLVDLRWQPF